MMVPDGMRQRVEALVPSAYCFGQALGTSASTSLSATPALLRLSRADMQL